MRVNPDKVEFYAKACPDCSKDATCKPYPNYAAITCTCTSGSAGNGFNCTKLVFCDSTNCCPQGYTWSKDTQNCVDIDECKTNTDKCATTNNCYNKNGIYICKYDASILCPDKACSSDRDCVKQNGLETCVDPCNNPEELDGASRLFTINSTGRFQTDRYNFGWFRYKSGYRMKQGPVGSLKCGSLNPYSLVPDYQTITQTVQTVSLWSNTDPPAAGPSIQVKACPGGYYVYKFSGSLAFEVYCTEPPTTPTTEPPTTPTTTTTTTEPPTTPTTTTTTEPPTTPTTTTTTEPPTTPTTTTTTEPPTTPTTEQPTIPTTEPPTTPTSTSTAEPTTEPTTELETKPTEAPTPKPETDTITLHDYWEVFIRELVFDDHTVCLDESNDQNDLSSVVKWYKVLETPSTDKCAPKCVKTPHIPQIPQPTSQDIPS
ncbi:uromodulin-like [Anomaloglossus baeobatrachus]|uniref:uromodulin-like n=1 Tax=Anomaloglossus baeobatrachus TaxID=238106 RepID=UPI003F5064DE